MKVCIADVKSFITKLNKIISGHSSSSLKEEPIELKAILPKDTLVPDPERGFLTIKNSTENPFYRITEKIPCEIKEEGEVLVIPKSLQALNKRVPDGIAIFTLETTEDRIIYNLGTLGSIREPIFKGERLLKKTGLDQQDRNWELIIEDSVERLAGEKEIGTPICEGISILSSLNKKAPICIKTDNESGTVTLVGTGEGSQLLVSIDYNTEVHNSQHKCWIIPQVIDYIKPQFVDSEFRLYKDLETDNLFKIEFRYGEIIYITDSTILPDEYDSIDIIVDETNELFIKIGSLGFRAEDLIKNIQIHTNPEDNSSELTLDLDIEETCLKIKGDSTNKHGIVPLNNLQYKKDNWAPISFYSIEVNKIPKVYSYKGAILQLDIYKRFNKTKIDDPSFIILKMATNMIGGNPTMYLPSNVKNF